MNALETIKEAARAARRLRIDNERALVAAMRGDLLVGVIRAESEAGRRLLEIEARLELLARTMTPTEVTHADG